MKILYKNILRINRKILLGIATLIIAVIFIYSQKANQQPQFEFISAQKENLQSSVSGSGSLTGKDQISLKFKTGGKLNYLAVSIGDLVTTGETIASLDTTDNYLTLQQAQNNLRDKQATVDKVIDDIHLFQYGNLGTTGETMSQRQTRTTAEVARDNAVDSVQLAQKNLSDDFLVSPIEGIVTQTSVIPGQNISGDIIAQIVSTNPLYFDTEVDVSDIGQIKLGQRVEVNLDSFANRSFSGSVTKITPQIKTVSSGGSVVVVRVDLGNPGIPFINGLTGQATIITQKVKNVLSLPIEAVREDNTILVQTQSGVKVKPVKTGLRSDDKVEITNGISETDKVVKNPPVNFVTQSRNMFNQVFRFIGGGRGR